MIFTRQGSPRSSCTIPAACRGVSFSPSKRIYSNDSRRWCAKSYRRRRATRSAMGLVSSTGIIFRRSSWKGLWSDMARWHCEESRNRRVPSISPEVETVMRRGDRASPQSEVSMSIARNTSPILSKGSPIPIKTIFVMWVASSTEST